MTHRTTTQDIETQVLALEDSLKALGMMPLSDRLHVHMGSKTYGQAFRLERHTVEGAYGNPPHGLPEYLGMTKRDAHATLYTINRSLWAVLNARRSSGAVA
ncbi:MAG: hypothetical protein ACPGGE_06200 [Poseidonia sp.]|jgi:hypothetical protein